MRMARPGASLPAYAPVRRALGQEGLREAFQGLCKVDKQLQRDELLFSSLCRVAVERGRRRHGAIESR